MLMVKRSQSTTMERKALGIAKRAHEGQKRASGEPYIEHPKEVAHLLKSDLKAGDITIAAAILHDTIEDTNVTQKEIEENFGKKIFNIVDGVTKLGALEKDISPQQRNLESIRKMFRAMGKDIRVIIIKLADRLHNMQTTEHLQKEKQQRIARETLDIFCPLANLLGIRPWFHQLSDLSFKILNPMEYALIVRKRNEKKKRLKSLEQWAERLSTFLKENGCKGVTVEVRSRHLQGIYHSNEGQWNLLDHIENFYRIYIITKNQDNCYEALGKLHQFASTLPQSISDYIAHPKPNNYQALHTMVISGLGNPIKVIIQSKEMDKIATFGIALAYQLPGDAESYWQKLPIWVDCLVSLEHDTGELQHFFQAVQSEIFGERCRVHITGKKDKTVDLPCHASVLDAAFYSNEKDGRSVTKAIVNGHEVGVKHLIEDGDVIELVKSKRGLERRAQDMLYTYTSQGQKLLVQALSSLPRQKKIQCGKQVLSETLSILADPFFQTSWSKALQTRVLKNKDALSAVGSAELNPFSVIDEMCSPGDFFLLDPHLFTPSSRFIPNKQIRFALHTSLEVLRDGDIIGLQTRPDVIEVMSKDAMIAEEEERSAKELISLEIEDRNLLKHPFIFALKWHFSAQSNPLNTITKLQNILETPIILQHFEQSVATLTFHTSDLSSMRIAYGFLFGCPDVQDIVRISP